ncbi:hypothetical protein [Micromonospora sp. NPDC049799]|uniref:hypothetical protein n=1 Tax=Micromonospora sp. NPDC049799 TaxID=3154741 RepID=UPI0033FA4B34
MAAALLVAGCSGTDETTTLEVELRLSACTAAGAECFALTSEGVRVTATTFDGRPLGTGTTDQRGVTTMTVSLTAPERVRVTASSPLIEGGSEVAEVDVPPRGLTSLTLSANLSRDVRGHAG